MSVNAFSSPLIRFGSQRIPTGIAGKADCRRAHMEHRFLMAARGDESGTCQPKARTCYAGKRPYQHVNMKEAFDAVFSLTYFPLTMCTQSREAHSPFLPPFSQTRRYSR